ncbi:angiogenic factor with G patch and FHA domains 1 isoform X1 [Glossina fuscipes]|uniref:Angiogenic factor with G patch and FHA domains 1 isoform X1 n=1 Tax=Glossina fuscipes TaxID=7396 RepID=A0A9C5YTL7_9MUSC|nr:angiogenic factor with G patch and FHA domains 1 isoform X1 [Glossina fuscipes]
MSSSETENSEKCEKSLKSKRFLQKTIRELRQLEEDKLFQYIERLHNLLNRNERKLKKYKAKTKKLQKQVDGFQNSPKIIQNQIKSTDQSRLLEEVTTQEQSKKDEDQNKHLNENETSDPNEISANDAFTFVDEMRQAAQNAQNISNFVYEPTSGLYYDQNSGYYYNAEYGLYYDGNTGCYYRFNDEKNSYEFHSQVQVQPTKTKDITSDNYLQDDDEVIFDEFGVVTDQQKLKILREEKEQEKRDKEQHKQRKGRTTTEHKGSEKSKKRKHSRKRSLSGSDMESDKKVKADIEDGELSTSSSSGVNDNSDTNSEEDKQKVPVFKSGGRFQDIAKKYPPSLRIIVQETNLEDLKVGSLSIITYKGGSLGREGNHDVIIPDVNVSKYHLKFIYDTKKSVYKCVDLGSRNGTLLNGQRMSVSKSESDCHNIVHGSVLQIGQTKLLCHVHEGNSTCGLCEPGLLIDSSRETSTGSAVVLSHKEQLKKLQKKYGLENEKFVDAKQQTSNNYNDRAATRRLHVGSSTDKEKTQTASVDTEIPSDNKGFKILSKLGWSKGEALGKTTTGLLEPINVECNTGTKGFGCQDSIAATKLSSSEKKKLEMMKKTQQRYQNADIFDINDKSS